MPVPRVVRTKGSSTRKKSSKTRLRAWRGIPGPVSERLTRIHRPSSATRRVIRFSGDFLPNFMLFSMRLMSTWIITSGS